MHVVAFLLHPILIHTRSYFASVNPRKRYIKRCIMVYFGFLAIQACSLSVDHFANDRENQQACALFLFFLHYCHN